mmetsp:Transcript_10076/g.25193  ORF Transcript_10076/g.25193 Transcript_10076/m.25193 type:complete len:114 (+) Transcript_10076:356-697(+)
MRTITKSMCGIVKSMEKSLNSMDMAQIGKVMDKFEEQFEDLDVKASYVQDSVSQSSTLSTPASEVESFISQVADEHGLELSDKLKANAPSAKAPATGVNEQDALSSRLERLKG